MERTTIMLPQDLKVRASQYASKKGISLGQLVHESLEKSIDLNPDNNKENDSLFKDVAVFEGESPYDLSKSHDDHLYGG